MFLLGALTRQSRPNFDLTIMTKPRAIVLFGSLTLMITGYAAWCSRTFWMRVGPPDLSPIPESQRAAALAAVEESGLTTPDSFSWEVMRRARFPGRATPRDFHAMIAAPILSLTRRMVNRSLHPMTAPEL